MNFLLSFAPQISYPNAKKLETEKYKRENGVFQLTENEHFNYIKVNLTNSTVHVPTNVFDECKYLIFSSFPPAKEVTGR